MLQDRWVPESLLLQYHPAFPEQMVAGRAGCSVEGGAQTDTAMTTHQGRPGNCHDPADAIPRLTLICGHQRSGTSVLRRVLSTHPQVRITHELQAFRRPDADWPTYLRGLRWSWWSRDYMDLGRRPRWKRAVQSAWFVARYGSRMMSLAQRRVDLGSIRSALHRSFPEALVVGDKDPEYVFQLDRLADSGEIKCIVIYRDGRDVVRSALVEANTKWRGLPLAAETNTAAKAASRWAKAIACHERNASRILAIQYEEFVTQPSGVLARLGEYLGVDPGEFHRDLVRPSSIGKHRHSLTADDLRLIESIAGDALRRLGYL